MSEDTNDTGDLKDILNLDDTAASELGIEEAPKEEDPKPEPESDTLGEEQAGQSAEATPQSPLPSDAAGTEDHTETDASRDAAQAQLDTATAPSPAAVAGEAEGPHDEPPVAQETVDESTDAKGEAHTLALGDAAVTEDPAPFSQTPDVVDESGMGGENGTEQTAHDVDPLAGVETPAPEEEHEPEFKDTVQQVASAKAVLPSDVVEKLKEGGNLVTKAMKGYAPVEEQLTKIDNEAKARLGFVRQKSAEFVAALELFFYRA